MLTDYHMHLENGDFSRDWAFQFWETAQKRGVAEIGFSEHVYRFKEAVQIVDNSWARERCTEDLEEYVQLILDLKAEGLPVKLGLEVDYFPGKEGIIEKIVKSYPFDYVLGSVHWLGDWGFDIPEFATEWNRRDLWQVYAQYFALIEQAATSGLFHSLSHPDVIKVFGHAPAESLTDLYRQTLQAVVAVEGLCIEVSTAGLRKPVGRMYPEPELLRLANAQGVPVTLASDAHYPEDVGKDYQQAVRLLQEAGYQSITRFSGGLGEQVTLG